MRNQLLSSFALLTLTGLANAGVVTSTLNSVTPAEGLTFTLVGYGSQGTSAGQFNWTATSNGSTFGLNVDGSGNYTAFCIEVTQNVGIGGSYTYTEDYLQNAPDPDNAPYSPMGLVKANQIARLFTVYNNDVSGNPASLKAAALQVAIWETVYDLADMNPNAGSGNFHVDNGAVSAYASGYLTDQAFAAQALGLYALTSLTNQDMVVTPAPGAAALLGLGGLIIARRRR